jgi:hypothetical protein
MRWPSRGRGGRSASQKRKAAWEATDAREIREVEFKTKDGQYDLRPSVYEIEEEELVQAFAEHAAAAPIDPPGSALGIDFFGVRSKVESALGNDKFSFIRAQHREIALSSASELDEVIELARRELSSRRRDIPKASVYTYVSERLAANDRSGRDSSNHQEPKSGSRSWLPSAWRPGNGRTRQSDGLPITGRAGSFRDGIGERALHGVDCVAHRVAHLGPTGLQRHRTATLGRRVSAPLHPLSTILAA